MHISTFEFIIKIILNDKNLTMLTFFFHLKIKNYFILCVTWGINLLNNIYIILFIKGIIILSV